MRIMKLTQLKIAVEPINFDYKTFTRIIGFTEKITFSWPNDVSNNIYIMSINHILEEYLFPFNDFNPMYKIMQVGEMIGVEIIA